MRPTVMQLQLLLLLSHSLCLSLAVPRPPSRNIIKVRASGFLPFESDLLLPFGILQQLQAQDRASRLLPPHPPRRRVKAKPKPKQQIRLERAHAQNGMQLYNLIDDDGELLLNLRVHTENGNGSGGGKQNSLNTLEEEQQGTPWRPSKWRPTSAPPQLLGLPTSSSPRPLPLHQYLDSNSLEQHHSQSPSQSASTQQRRMFGLRADWNYK